MENLDTYNKLRKPPATALKKIKGGRLKGMTDINPQWRYEALTDVFGPCGIGWKYEISELWTTDGSADQKMAHAKINLYVNVDGWSEPIPGIGGNMLVTKESAGLHTNDEAYKMAVTDALSVACKMLGIGGDIYSGNWDGEKYTNEPIELLSTSQIDEIKDLILESGTKEYKFLQWAKHDKIEDIPASSYPEIIAMLKAKLEQVKKDEDNK